MRQRKSWEMSEEEVLALEEKYTEKLGIIELIMYNHVYYFFFMLFSSPLWFLIGLLVGLLISK
jgi:hypothetical protein